MSCVISIVCNNGDIIMGGDSYACDVQNWTIDESLIPKVFIKGDMIFGCVQSFRMMQLVKYKFDIPKHDKTIDDLTYLTTIFVDQLRDLFRVNGIESNDSGVISQDSNMLVGYNGNVYVVNSDYHIHPYKEKYQSIGCGKFHAIGAMDALIKTIDADIYTPENETDINKQLIELALETSIKYNAFVGGDIIIETLMSKKDE